MTILQNNYFGHQIWATGVQPNLDKVIAIQQWPQPTDLKEFRGILGLFGYYRQFIHGYGKITAPLTSILQKDA